MLKSIQIARAMAVLATMVAHLEWVYNDIKGTTLPWTNPWLLMGGHGVDLFFCISGFIIAYLLSEKDWSVRDFLSRRIVRIYPLYWVFTLSYGLAISIGCSTGERGDCQPFDLNYVVSSLLILPLDRYPLLSVGWSLEHEIIFYAIACAVCVALRLPIQRLLQVVLLFGCVGIGIHVIIPSITGGKPAWDYDLFSLYHFQFAAGIAVFLLKDRLVKANPFLLFVGGVVGFCATHFITRLMPGPIENIETWRAGVSGLVSVLGYAASSAAIIAGLLGAEVRGLFRGGHRTWLFFVWGLVLVGNASYALYLMQPLAYGVIGKVFGALNVDVAMMIPALMATVAATLIAGGLWYTFIERPFLHMAQRALTPARVPGTPV